ncbi:MULTISPECIES: DUF4159 domain-containing protein [unclassified Mucilaginibacter]|uniref:DUF4159 domain-containing protein n=1 Tax=unclassified Mucilaginibacter TaxID=2617802 RepID=UPI002AC97A25|nr:MULTISPECIES: DUF4159 domain-containing protein [unclassified Mucilaginibacter]MEB0262146.1 DUF4159 domain-containing protein [Mucilaginibacter sp. 10I4]MEB0279807.1 DUF4159 domain-containing protein [Mucilaginibacter sp. 10B2]MEB0301241.1 DUF4159 domain-containing protein [Mucilaginibacter sp. 5C4]WPX24221.1 DUF4159 domain-containing protein [Mucilaginibacter sp. 5C4]
MRRSVFVVAAFTMMLCINSFTAPSYKMGRLKYNGGGDWYGDRTALINLIKFCNDNLKTNFQPEEEVVEVGSDQIYNYPFIFMTGHGNVIFSDQEARNLRKYLTGGGFLHIDDNYGFDKFIRPQMKKVFPELDFVELPTNYAIYEQKYSFPNGLPKIHEHDGKRPQGFGLIYKGRLVCFYTFECDLGNGWEDYGTYAGDSQEERLKALKMGANLIQYIFTK